MSESKQTKRLYRSGTDHVLAGVCAGIAEHLNTDPLLIRILWLLTVFINGLGLLAYFICMIAIPLNPEHAALPPTEKKKNSQYGLFAGIAMVLFGLVFLSHNIIGHHFYWWDQHWFGFWPFFRWNLIWPLVIIAFGVWYIVMTLQKHSGDEQQQKTKVSPGFTRKKSNRMISGVCSGLAEHWNVDVVLVRIGYVLLTLVTHVLLGVGVYIALAILIPDADSVPIDQPEQTS